jgi:serine phosphatase RsbU (regulator of sigma subunit)
VTTPTTRRARGVLSLVSDPSRTVSIDPLQPAVLGRSEECTARFGDSSLSRMHARVRCEGGTYILSDLGSTNGTFVNDRRIEADTELRDGDMVRLGKATKLRFSLREENDQGATYEGALRTVKLGDVELLSSRLKALDDKGELKEDLLQAREFQQQALSALPQLDAIEVEVVYQPHGMVSGDLYNFTVLGPRLLRMLVADATGHGVKASLTTMLILSEWELIKASPATPGRLLAELNDRILATFGRLDVRFTAVCLELDLDAGSLRHASAAHPAPCLIRGGDVQELECGGTFMALVEQVEYPEWEVPIAPGDTVLAFTDGLTDEIDPSGGMFGSERLLEVARRAHSLPAALRQALIDFSGSDRTSDDVTIVTARWKA